MATARPTSSTLSPSALTIRNLAELCRVNGHRFLSGDSKMCLTSYSLSLLINHFQAAKLEIPFPILSVHSLSNSTVTLPSLSPVQNIKITTDIRNDLIFLHDLLSKIPVVKLTRHMPTLQGNVLLYPFRNVTCLELKRIEAHMVLGLSVLSQQLETLICTQCINKIETLFGDCGGDLVQSKTWPRLKSLFLAHNFIRSIDKSLKYLEALELLDLSHNRITDCKKLFEIVPQIRHLNLSSNLLRQIPAWSESMGSCRLLTLKIRQNTIEDIAGIEQMKSIEELDFSENFIARVPEQIRTMHSLKHLSFQGNPFFYAADYRLSIVSHLPFVFSQETRELMIDDLPLTLREKQRIPRAASRPNAPPQSFGFNPVRSSVQVPSQRSASSSATTVTNESTTDPEYITTSSSGTVVSRRRSGRKPRGGRTRVAIATEVTPEHPSSSDNESTSKRDRPGRSVESRRENDNNLQTTQTPAAFANPNVSSSHQSDDASLRAPLATSTPGTGSQKLVPELSRSPKRRKSPRFRKSEPPSKIVFEAIDSLNALSDATPVPESPQSDRNLSFSGQHTNPILKPEIIEVRSQKSMVGDSTWTTFFVTDQTSDTQNNRILTIEIDRMYLVEKDTNDGTCIEKIRYSTIKLSTNNNNNNKCVEFTFEKRRGEVETRIYLFDTEHDQKAFIEEIERHLETSSKETEVEVIPSQLVECVKCHQTFPRMNATSSTETALSFICTNCQTTVAVPSQGLDNEPEVDISVDTIRDENELDHRLHFDVADKHFTQDGEEIKLHFRSYAVRSTIIKYFVAHTILSNYGIYIYEYDSSSSNAEPTFTLVGKDLLTNVLMLDIGYRLQTFTIELQSAAFAFIFADQQRTQDTVNSVREILSPVVQSGEGALQKISRISSDEYRQRLFNIIKLECNINEPCDEMIDFYSIMIRIDPNGNSQMIALLLLRTWILMIEDAYATIDSRHVRLPAPHTSESASGGQQLKCDLIHLVNVTSYSKSPKLLVVNFVDESETQHFQWKLESITNENKNEFLRKVRDTYQNTMGVSMPELIEPV